MKKTTEESLYRDLWVGSSHLTRTDMRGVKKKEKKTQDATQGQILSGNPPTHE